VETLQVMRFLFLQVIASIQVMHFIAAFSNTQ
jgi:hypothetical protein